MRIALPYELSGKSLIETPSTQAIYDLVVKRSVALAGDEDHRSFEVPTLFRGAPLPLVHSAPMPEGPSDRNVVRFILSSGVDENQRDDKYLEIGGLDFAGWDENRAWLWCHLMQEPWIGRGLARRIYERSGNIRELWIDVEFAPKDLYPFGHMIGQMHARGFLRACSIGWLGKRIRVVRGKDGRPEAIHYLEADVMEGSSCPVPIDRFALQEAVRRGIIDTDACDMFARAARIPTGNFVYEVRGMTIDRDLLTRAIKPDTGRKLVEEKVFPEQEDWYASEEAREMATRGAENDNAVTTRAAAPPAAELGARTEIAEAEADLEADPLRWNRQLSRAWDVTREQYWEGTPELTLASRYFDAEVREISEWGDTIPSARMGAFLTALDQTLGDWTVDTVRRIVWDYGKKSPVEYPPVYETVRLNSTLAREFLIDGTRFMKAPKAKALLKITPAWSGLDVTLFAMREQKDHVASWYEDTKTRAAELNFLKGEAFSLGGEFLSRSGETWGDLFLDAKCAAALQRQVALINEKGDKLASRGIILLGPPGTGKTLAGRVMMNEAKDATFIWISARDLYRSGAFGGFSYGFRIARECAPAILFVEDIDHFLDDHSIDLLKSEMDGVKQNRGIVTVLTTNYPERLPAALIDRPGRFHDVLKLDLPDPNARSQMLAKWLPDLTDAKLRQSVLDSTKGYSGAHMRELATFVGVLREQDGVDLPTAVARALGKIAEQREMIDQVQTGVAYRPRRAVEEAVEGLVAIRSSSGATTQAGARMVKQEDDGWHVYAEDGETHLGGPYETEEEAKEHQSDLESEGEDSAKAARGRVSTPLAIACDELCANAMVLAGLCDELRYHSAASFMEGRAKEETDRFSVVALAKMLGVPTELAERARRAIVEDDGSVHPDRGQMVLFAIDRVEAALQRCTNATSDMRDAVTMADALESIEVVLANADPDEHGTRAGRKISAARWKRFKAMVTTLRSLVEEGEAILAEQPDIETDDEGAEGKALSDRLDASLRAIGAIRDEAGSVIDQIDRLEASLRSAGAPEPGTAGAGPATDQPREVETRAAGAEDVLPDASNEILARLERSLATATTTRAATPEAPKRREAFGGVKLPGRL